MPKKLTIDIFQKIAKRKNGEILSKIYINNSTPMKFKCKKGHKWFARPDKINNQGTWCPECAGTKRNSIKDMKYAKDQNNVLR